MKKIVWVMNFDDYAPELTAITFPFLKLWCARMGAEFRQITVRCFPEWDMDYERMQIFEAGRGADWNINIDADVLVHPDFGDPTELIPPDHVCHWRRDVAYNRFVYDDYFRRDGRAIAACNVFTVTPRLCHDYWRPLDDLSPAEAYARIRCTTSESAAGVRSRHLVTDYATSRNLARFGLKHVELPTLLEKAGDPMRDYLCHSHMISREQKRQLLLGALKRWEVEDWPEVKEAKAAA